MNWKDEILLREYERFQSAEPVAKGMGPRAPLPDYPADIAAEAAARNAAEYWQVEANHRTELWKGAVREAKRYRELFTWAVLTTAIAVCVALAGWLR